MDTLTFIDVLIVIAVCFAILVTVWRVREEYQPDKFKVGEFERVRPRRQGFDQVYRSKEGIVYDIIGKLFNLDESAEFLLKHGRTTIPVHFEKHQLAPKGGNFLHFLAPSSARVAIELDGNIMNSLLGEVEYEGQWEDLLRDYVYYRNAYEIEKMKRESLEVNFEDRLEDELAKTGSTAVDIALKTIEKLSKGG